MSGDTMANEMASVRLTEALNGNVSQNNDGSPMDSIAMKKSNGLMNGVVSLSGDYSSSSTMLQLEAETATASFSEKQQVTVLHDSVVVTRRKFLTDFDDIDESYIYNTTIDSFLEYIERQRLTHMPHRGSHWDKVLKWAEYFALQISGYAKAVEPFVPDSRVAAQLIWTALRSLLRLGPDNAQALETTFGVFYRLGLSIAMLLRNSVFLAADGQIRTEVGQAFNALLQLVREVSLYYSLKLHTPAEEVSFDFNGMFGGQIAAFYQCKNHISDAMWDHSLGHEAAIEVRTLRKWLGPQDAGLQNLIKANDMPPADREEYTCEWFQSHLLAFTRSKNSTLIINGPTGCGKSVLAGWVVERLQRPLGRKSYMTLSCSIEADIPSEATSLAAAKRLLLQLLEITIGHKTYHTHLAKAYRLSIAKPQAELEKELWSCLETCLGHIQANDNLIVIVDGLDEITGGQKTAQVVVDRLGSLSDRNPHFRVIAFSRDTTLKPSKGETQSFAITPNHTHEDLRIVIDRCFKDYELFGSRTEHSKEHVVEQIIHAAKGNFLWAVLTTVLLSRENSEDGFNKAVKSAKETPIPLDETIAKLIGFADLARGDTGLIVSLMLIARRPFSTAELKNLLQVDLAKKHSVERKTDIIRELEAALGSLFVFRNGFVRFYHPTVKAQMLRIQQDGKRLRTRQATEREMTMRLLAYCDLNLRKPGEPTLSPMVESEVKKLLSAHALLEYAVRNWTSHFRSSAMYHSTEALQLDDEFKSLFPSSTQLSMLEWAIWALETSRFEATETLNLAFRVRKAVFPEQHVSVLQALIVCGSIWRETTRTAEAADCFYRAVTIGQHVLNRFHSVTTACTSAFLSITETTSTNTRTELVTKKEKLLVYIIEAYKFQHGKTHDLVIRYYKMLAQLYITIHEDPKAEGVWRELREVVIIRFGKGSEEETSISESLTIVLKKGDKKTDVIEYEQGIFDIVTELEVWNFRRIKLTLELAMSYEARGEFLMAEELFVFLWRRLTEECHSSHHNHGVEIHIHLMDVVIEYVRFLRRCQRHEEASSVLICIWTEYEEYDFESETMFLRLKIVGELMRAVSLHAVAVSVFRKCLSWFKSHGSHEQVTSCQTLIAETLEEITTIRTSSNTTTTSEITIKEAFEVTLSRNKVTTETISICKSLIAYHIRLEQWASAIEVTRRSLSVIWQSVISGSGTIALPKDFGSEAIDIAISLASCHEQSQHFHEAEEIFLRIYRACRNSCRIDEERLSKAYKVLVKFYELHRHWEKMIDLYKELLVEYRRHLGSKHPLTIHTLYIIGSLCADHGHTGAHQYYEEIVRELNHGSHICHSDALVAMMYLCRYHFEAGHWHKLQTVCKILWETWKGHSTGKDKFTVEFVEALYFRYSYVLEYHAHCELSVLRELTIEYRNSCLKIFGNTSAITIKAMMELARICMGSQKHITEAITIYEEIITHHTTTVSKTTITTIKQRLSEAYCTICTHNASVSNTTIARAITVLTERLEYLLLTYGWAHSETLASLRELLILYIRIKKQDLALRMLLEASVRIIVEEKHSQRLHESGRAVGQMFVSCDMNSHALEMIQELRLQIITGTASSNNKHGLKLDKSIGSLSFVFLVTLEQVVRGTLSISYSGVMADYLTESVLYELYTRSLKSSATIIIGHAARLRAFLVRHDRPSQREALETQSYEIFIKKWAINARSRETGLLYYVSLLVHIGDTVRDVQVGHIACLSSVEEVRALLESGQAQKAYEVAECAFDFIEHQRSYHHLQNVSAGFKLSALMVGRGVNQSTATKIDHKLRDSMLELSRKITRGVLKACKDSRIDFVRLKFGELNDLIGLLGEQQNPTDLEWILELLWKSREVQKNWKPSTIIAIGRRFVQARYLNASKERRSEAIRLCEDICYNMRRTWGALDPKTLEMSELLYQLYTNMGHHREAQDLQETILRLVVEGDDGDERTQDTMDSKTALHQVNLLKQSFLRLGGWNKDRNVYVDVIKELKEMPEFKDEKPWKQLHLPSDWNSKESPSDTIGKFVVPKEWEFVRSEDITDSGAIKETPSTPGMNMKRATSNWGLGLSHHSTHGDHSHGGINGNMNGGGRIAEKKAIAMDDGEGYGSGDEEVIHAHDKWETVY